VVFHNPDGSGKPLFDLFEHTVDSRLTRLGVMQAWTAVERIEDVGPVPRGAESDPALMAMKVARAPAEAAQIQRAAAAPVSSGRVLKAMAAPGAARWMALTKASNRTSRFGGSRTPAPITTQS